jgi:thioredoxin 1
MFIICLQVGSVPALIAIKNGKVQERLVGLQDMDKLRKFVDKLVHEK